MLRPWSIVLVVIAWVQASGCGSPAATSQGAACTYAQTIECTGDLGCAGVRTCTLDLAGFGPCVCGDAGAGDAGARDAGDAAARHAR